MASGEWKVWVSNKANKQIKKLPKQISDITYALLSQLEDGPIQTDWPNYGMLSKGIYHCHLKRGNPTYVACWRIIDKQAKEIEVYYVGTHENAPYERNRN